MTTPIPALRVLEGRYAVCRLSPDAAIPTWAAGAFVSVTRTNDELSVMCDETLVPDGVRAERGWRLLRMDGALPFDAVGVAASLTAPLAASGIPLLLVGTFDTDYLLVKAEDGERAVEALERSGIRISG